MHRYCVTCIILIAITALILITCGLRMPGASGRWSPLQFTLQSLASGDRRQCYNVEVDCESSVFSAGDDIRYRFRNVRLRVVRHGLGYQNTHEVFSRVSSKVYVATSSCVLPSWRAKYVPSPEFALPSGRVMPLEKDSFLFVFFDGESCEAFRFSAGDNGTRPALDTNRFIKYLNNMYESTFSTDDIYWCYCLIKCSSFFGFSSAKLDRQKFWDAKYFYDCWQSGRRE